MNKLVTLKNKLSSPDPCKECLVKVICTQICQTKSRWDNRLHSFLFPFEAVLGLFVVAVSLYLCFVASMLVIFGLANRKSVDRLEKTLNPFPPDMDLY